MADKYLRTEFKSLINSSNRLNLVYEYKILTSLKNYSPWNSLTMTHKNERRLCMGQFAAHQEHLSSPTVGRRPFENGGLGPQSSKRLQVLS